MSWGGFAGIFALFFITHSIPVRPAIKAQIICVIGRRGFSTTYSILSIGMLALLIWSAGRAPFVELWPQMPWQRHVVHVGMFVVCLILAFSIARPNPFSFGGACNNTFDPARAGIIRLTRHPILFAMSIWAGLHMVPNGDLSHVLLFGVLGGFALAGRTLINRRKQRDMGAQTWADLYDKVKQAPYLTAQGSLALAAIRLGLGVLAYLALLLAHPTVIGIPAI